MRGGAVPGVASLAAWASTRRSSPAVVDDVQRDVGGGDLRDERAREPVGQPLAVDELGQLAAEGHQGVAHAVLPAAASPDRGCWPTRLSSGSASTKARQSTGPSRATSSAAAAARAVAVRRPQVQHEQRDQERR